MFKGEIMEPLEIIRPEEQKEGICPTCHQKIEKKVARDDLRKVITVFKMASGFEKDDKSWDRLYFSRYMKSAKQLIEFLGNWERAADCIQHTVEKFDALGRSYTFETIVTHAAAWKKDNQERGIK